MFFFNLKAHIRAHNVFIFLNLIFNLFSKLLLLRNYLIFLQNSERSLEIFDSNYIVGSN